MEPQKCSRLEKTFTIIESSIANRGRNQADMFYMQSYFPINIDSCPPPFPPAQLLDAFTSSLCQPALCQACPLSGLKLTEDVVKCSHCTFSYHHLSPLKLFLLSSN